MVIRILLPLCLPVSTSGLASGWFPAGFWLAFWLAKQPGKDVLVSAGDEDRRAFAFEKDARRRSSALALHVCQLSIV